MIAMNLFQESHTTLRLIRYAIPLGLLTALACLSTLGTYAMVFYPAQDRLERSGARYQAALLTQQQIRAARQTQEILGSTWRALPRYREFTDLSLAIADLGARNHIKIPGMGYDFRPVPDKLGTKGTFAFDVEGNYEATRKFIYELEKRWPYLYIEKLSVEGSKKHDGVIFKMMVSTFLKELPESTPKTKS
jgi:hypothetical protein